MQAVQGDGKRATGRQRHAAAAVPPGAAGLQALQGLPDDALARLADAVVVRLADAVVVRLVGGPPPEVDQLLHRLADLVAERVQVRVQAPAPPPPPPELAELLPKVYRALGTKTWLTRDLWASTLIPRGSAHRIGQALGRLVDDDLLRGRCGGLQLHRAEGKGRRANQGVVWWLTRAGDDEPSSPRGKADTMQALDHAWRPR